MIDRATKLRFRRLYRRRRRQVEDLGVSAEENIELHFFKRLARLADVRRFVVAWLLLVLLLIGGVIFQAKALGKYYEVVKPQPGGVYTEGILGQFTDANPLYASGAVDSAVSRLLFSSLFRYDDQNKLVGDLAQSITADDKGVVYTVHLKPRILWHDGMALTSEDVAFTYKTIQNPDAKSSLGNSWQGITIATPDRSTVVFTLPNPFSAFPQTLTNGIVPQHLLNGIPVTRLRSIAFNTQDPIGSGPFKWEAVEVSGIDPADREQRIALVPNEQYYAGKPQLNKFIIRAFSDEKRLADSFSKQELTGAVGLTSVPEAGSKSYAQAYNIPLTGEVMVFFKSSDDIFADGKVRKALVMGANPGAIIQGLGFPVIVANEPLLKGQVGYDKTLVQAGFNVAAANSLLDSDGWLKNDKGIRVKGGHPLSFKLFSQSNSEYAYVTQALQKEWRAIGVDAQVILQQDTDLQTTISFHNYDALLYGVAIGSDPDVFAYWHSSQADVRSPNRLNLSEYKSSVADQALEAGRTRSDATLRTVKYRAFLDAWRNDAPALALYQPRFLYLTHGTVAGFKPDVMNASTDRFTNVQNWMIREGRVSK
ncbi:MAG: hypothetical protein JWS12_656 [Candidatus Saccharibacteria bacterium]|nr:hypothetical protein [Candidatus Saccharibacteria bacterium]